MFSVPYQNGIVLGMTDAEVREVIPYLRYTSYMFDKLTSTCNPQQLGVLQSIDDMIRRGAGVKVARNFVQQMGLKHLANRRHLGIFAGSAVIGGDHIYWLALSQETVLTFHGMRPQGTTDAVRELQKRLSHLPFPDAGSFYRFMSALRGLRFDVPSNSVGRVMATGYDWSSLFPSVFPKLVDLTAWVTEVHEIYSAFAASRRCGVPVVEKMLGVKL